MTNEKDELKQNLEQVVKENGPQAQISYHDLFNPQFMQRNTNFAAIDVFVRELGLKDFTEIENLDKKAVDDFVKKETKFNDWEQMQQQAISEFMTRLF